MAIEYAKSALSESIIPVKDYSLKNNGTEEVPNYISTPIGSLVQINTSGEIDVVAITNGLVTTTVTGTVSGLGVSEGMNFEGLGVTPKVGKVRISGNAIYRAPYGTITTTAGADQGKFIPVAPTQALIGTKKAIGFNSKDNVNITGNAYDGSGAKGFVVDSAGANQLVKIVDVDAKDGYVYFQIIPTALFTS